MDNEIIENNLDLLYRDAAYFHLKRKGVSTYKAEKIVRRIRMQDLKDC